MADTISEILAEGQRSLILFDEAGIKAVKALLTEKNGKPFIQCQIRGREVQAKPEEIIRQLWIQRLLAHYHYPLARIQIEYPITFGRDTSKRADIIVMDADRPNVPYLIIEVKREKAKDGKEQLKSYTHATGAPLAVWSDGSQAITWHRKNPNYFVEIPDLPTAQQTIEQIVNEPWTMETLIEKEKEREAEGIKARSLRPGFHEFGKLCSNRRDQAGLTLHALVIGHHAMRIAVETAAA
jgi:type I restriction enzyme M protein